MLTLLTPIGWDKCQDGAFTYDDTIGGNCSTLQIFGKWTNFLALINLLFYRMSENIKTTNIGEDRLDELLHIVEGPLLPSWDLTSAQTPWWEDRTRRTPSSTRDSRKSENWYQ